MKTARADFEPLPAFPIRTIRFGIALMIALLLGSTFLTWRMESEIRQSMEAQVDVLTAAEKVDHYGTVLDLSIRAVVTSGDPVAAARYRTLQPQLRALLTRLRSEVRGQNAIEAAQVDRSDLALISMEYEALELASHGQFDEARQIIHGKKYEYLMDAYTQGIRGIEQRAARYVDSIKSQLNFNLWLIMGMSAASLFLVIVGWFALLVPMRRWGDRLDSAYAQAEHAARQLHEKQLELEQTNSLLFEQARTDALTGLSTRLRFHEDIEQLWPRIARKQLSVCALMCDIDLFKQYNDTYGHVSGDEALREVAKALESERRAGDQIYRMGGEEFLIVLHDCSLGQAKRRAEDYRKAVGKIGIPHVCSTTGEVSVSIGVAPAGLGPEPSIQSWLSDADKALYEAKAAGRNAVVTWKAMAA